MARHPIDDIADRIALLLAGMTPDDQDTAIELLGDKLMGEFIARGLSAEEAAEWVQAVFGHVGWREAELAFCPDSGQIASA